MPRVLIVAYGNPLRSDDSLAWRAADALEEKFSQSDVEIIRLHQLGPELAETASKFDGIVFVDAASPRESCDPGTVQVTPIHARHDQNETLRFSHAFNPEALLAMAVTLYGAAPQAVAVTVVGENFDHGELLSPSIEAALTLLVGRIEGLVQRFLSSTPGDFAVR